LSNALPGSPGAICCNENRSRQQLASVVVVREHVSQIGASREEQRRSLEGASGRSAPARTDANREYPGIDARRDQPARQMT
jgi:hypothetical protein